MCEWGTCTNVFVKIPADLSHIGKSYFRNMPIDSCIAPLVKALQEGGIDMRGSCCGHGASPFGNIGLQDGRTLEILQADNEVIEIERLAFRIRRVARKRYNAQWLVPYLENAIEGVEAEVHHSAPLCRAVARGKAMAYKQVLNVVKVKRREVV